MVNLPTLLGLPAELQIEVSKRLENDDLLVLRKTCRELAASTTDVFASRFFRKRRHLYTTHSLQALCDISGIPKLARHIQSVELVVARPEQGQILNQFASHSRDNTFVPPPQAVVDAAARWYEDERNAVREHACNYLTQIFKNLKDLHAGQNFKLSSDLWIKVPEDNRQDLGRGYEHSKVFERKTGVYGTPHFISKIHPWATGHDIQGDIALVARKVISALSESEHPLQVLDLGCKSIDTSTRYKRKTLCVPDTQVPGLLISLANLKVVKLAVRNEYSSDVLVHLLCSATGLTDLSLDCTVSRTIMPDEDTTDDFSIMKPLQHSLKKHKLVSIALIGLKCEFLDLLRFIARQATSLQHLELSHVSLRAPEQATEWDGWRRFFKLASKRLSLRSLSLEGLQETIYDEAWDTFDTCRYFIPDRRTHSFAVEGEEHWMKDRIASVGRKGLYWFDSEAEISDDEDDDTEFGEEDVEGTDGEVAGDDGVLFGSDEFGDWDLNDEPFEEIEGWRDWQAAETC